MAPAEAELAELFDRAPIGVCRVTAAGGLRYANQAFAAIVGYTLDELRDFRAIEFFVDQARRAAMLDECISTGKVDGATVIWRHRDGHHLTVRLFGQLVTRGDDVCIDVSVLDLTEHERTTAQLRAQGAELERAKTTLDMVVAQVSAIWWVVDRELVVVRNGGPIQEVLGYAPRSTQGRSLADVLVDEPDAAASIAAHHRALAGETVRFTMEYRHKLVESTIAPHRIDGEIVGAIGTTMDVTAVRMLERRMVDAQRAESLGVLAGGLAHDFNNLLVAILGNADLALRELPRGIAGRESVEHVRTASLRAAELTSQLLAFAGRASVSTDEVEVDRIAAELVQIFTANLPRDVRIELEMPAGLSVRGDAGQIRQVVMNLLTNAREAMADRTGAIRITGEVITHDGTAHPDDVLTATAGSYASIAITDSGPGMILDVRRRVFEPFFTTKPTGHGLGLAAALGIVRAHGGGVRLVTSEGNGASFQVTWPLATQPARVVTAGPRTVLVIDDEDLVRDVVARMIQDLGYRTVTAPDGPTGLEIVAAGNIDAVLVDMTMPRMSGRAVVAALRESRPELPVVICTGYDRDHLGPVRATAYLPKPFRLDALAQTLSALFTSDT